MTCKRVHFKVQVNITKTSQADFMTQGDFKLIKAKHKKYYFTITHYP